MENLPLEIGLEILCRLPITSLFRLKSVSRSLQSLTQNPRLPALYLAHAGRRFPSLLLHSDACAQLHHLDSDASTNAVRLSSGDLDFTNLVPTGSCNGLLCISNDRKSLTPVFLLNPFTGHRIHLPQPTSSYPRTQHVAVGFGSDPAHKIVRVAYYNRPTPFGFVWTSQTQVLTIGTGATWREIGRTTWNLRPGPSEAVLANSALHWLTLPFRGRVKIVSFDLRREEFREIVFPEGLDDPEGGRGNLTHLVALSGHLSAAAVSGDGGRIELWVMKEYGVAESWSRDFVIDGSQLAAPSLNPNGEVGAMMGMRVLCRVESSGAVLVQIGGCRLVKYWPETGELEELVVSGIPTLFSVTVHMESL